MVNYQQILTISFSITAVILTISTLLNKWYDKYRPHQKQSKFNMGINILALIGMVLSYVYASFIVGVLTLNTLQFIFIQNKILQIIILGIASWSVLATGLCVTTIKINHVQLKPKHYPFIKYSGMLGVSLILLSFIYITFKIIFKV